MPYKNPEDRVAQSKRWYHANKEKQKATNKVWRTANKDKVAEDAKKKRASRPLYYKQLRQKWYQANREKARNYSRNRNFILRYGLTLGERTKFIASKNSTCDVCLTKTDKPHVDHCHRKGHIRGLLCGPCNLALGHVKDSPARLRSLANYLEGNLHGRE